MKPRASRAELRDNLRRSYADGVFFCLMVGLGESYLPAFALAVGHSEVVSGLIASVPVLLGALLQLATPWGVHRMGSHRRWVVLCTSLQAVSFAPLCAAALHGRISVSVLFLIAALYWATGLAAGPAWNTWITTIVPAPIRARYFALRTRAAQSAVIAGLLAAGLALEFGERRGRTLEAFALIFLFAGVCRALSTRMLALQTEPAPMPSGWRSVSFGELVSRLRHGRDGRLLAYLFVLQIAVQIGFPFTTPYVLEQLDFGYRTYMALFATVFVGRVISLPLLGNIAKRHGAVRVLWLGGIGLALQPLPWVVSSSLGVLFAAQAFAGFAWAAFELAMLLSFYDSIPERERTSVLTFFNLGNSLCMAAGALLGGWFLSARGAGETAYTQLFLLTSAARFLALVFLWRFAQVANASRASGYGSSSNPG